LQTFLTKPEISSNSVRLILSYVETGRVVFAIDSFAYFILWRCTTGLGVLLGHRVPDLQMESEGLLRHQLPAWLCRAISHHLPSIQL
jgi:hypothetical protein